MSQCLPQPGEIPSVSEHGQFVFPLPANASLQTGSTVVLRVPGNWRGVAEAARPDGISSIFCLTIVQQPTDCNRCIFNGDCKARPLWRSSRVDIELSFEIPLPAFAADVAAHGAHKEHNHSVCARSNFTGPILLQFMDRPIKVIGRLSYYPLPKVRFETDLVRVHMVNALALVDFGLPDVISINCQNCSAASRLAIRPFHVDSHCHGSLQQALAVAESAVQTGQMPASHVLIQSSADQPLSIAMDIIRHAGNARWVAEKMGLASSDCKIPNHGPCDGYLDQTPFDVVNLLAKPANLERTEGVVEYSMNEHVAISKRDRIMLLNRRSILCFYPHVGASYGWFVGLAFVDLDVQHAPFYLLVFLFGVVLPFVTVITALFHLNKLVRCRQHLQHLRIELQREQLGRELAILNADFGNSRAHSSDSDWRQWTA